MTAQRATFGADRLKRDPKRFDQPKKWNHQIELERLKGKPITLMTTDGPLAGTLLDADQYTLRVRIDRDGAGGILTFFKSALVGYGAA